MAGPRWSLGVLAALVGIVTVLIAIAVQAVISPVPRAQAYLAAVQAIATLLLVVLTAVYVHSTHAMAQEMRVSVSGQKLGHVRRRPVAYGRVSSLPTRAMGSTCRPPSRTPATSQSHTPCCVSWIGPGDQSGG